MPALINSLLDSLLLVILAFPLISRFDLSRIAMENKRNFDTQAALNSLLRLMIEDISLDEILNRTLDTIFSLPWFTVQPRGAIFLVEDELDVLVMKAQKNLSEPIRQLCSRVPFGKCLCGRTALTKDMQFADRLDSRHEIMYEGINPHGHYCVPILLKGKVLGVVNLYLDEKYARDKTDEVFLLAVADLLAGIIQEKRFEEGQRKAQERLIQASKMDVVGRLAGGVAHEVKNPLAIVLMGTDYLSGKINAGDKRVLSTLNDMKAAIKRADDVIKDLLDFSRVSELNITAQDINSILNNALVLVKYQIDSAHVEIHKDLKEDIPRVQADRNKIEQVFVNIILNSIQAMPDGGTLTVRTYAKKVTGDTNVVIEIEDTGTGISEDNLNNIFEPFFTTRRDKGGTGLGLFIVRNIIEMHKGRVEIINKKDGHGTKTTITLKG
ncbi:MAG: ATP-binding protein [Candidatus Omnitrophica bacterium]|nr:ATP-binding protein [Candidatus Omnitrophota bacterium]